MDLRHNWHKFRSIFHEIPRDQKGLGLLAYQGKAIHGSLSHSTNSNEAHIDTKNMNLDIADSAWDMLADKHQLSSLTIIQRENLLRSLNSVVDLDHNGYKNSYYFQLKAIREQLFSSKSENAEGIEILGSRHAENTIPHNNFFLEIFDNYFSEILPEKRLLCFGVVDEGKKMDSLLINYEGNQIKGFIDPDWQGFDWRHQMMDLFNPESGKRFVSWCENRFQIPSYTFFISRRLWEQSCVIQKNEGKRAAWRYFLHMKNQREMDSEVLVEPEPWPLKLILRWNGIKNF